MRWVMSKPQKFCAIWCEMTFIWLIFLRILFLQKFSFQAIFSVFRQKNGAPKWTKTVNFAKFKVFDGFFISNTVFVLLENYLLSKFQQDQTIFVGLRGQTRPPTPPPPPKKKRSFHLCLINAKNYENFQLHNYKYYTDKTLYLNKVFHLAKPWGIRA